MDVLSHFANHTYVVDSKIKRAKGIEDLKSASMDFINIIKSLQIKGVKVNHISNLIGQLNTKVYQKLYKFDNNYGAFVINHRGSCGLELAVILFDENNPKNYEICYNTPIASNVIGWLTEEELEKTLEKIKNL